MRSRLIRRRATAWSSSLVLVAAFLVVPLGTTAAGATDLDNVGVTLSIEASGLNSPTAMAARPGDPRMYVAEQGGRVKVINTNHTVSTVLTVAVNTSGERGLIGLAFSPDDKLYINYTDNAGTIHLVEYEMSGDVALVGTARELLSIPHPRTNHNGGQLAFGPDGMLYMATGDGGGGGDPDENGQDVNELLGKILRIDPTPQVSPPQPYTIPPDNPFVGMANHREEIWMYGLRNPWRFSFDKLTGDMWIGDVGQNLYEEVDYAPQGEGGQNWGWNLREGFHPYNGGAQPPGGDDPLFEETHGDGWCALIGGYVYRGSAIANLDGAYVFGDFCRSQIRGAVRSGNTLSDEQDLGITVASLTSMGEDINGELYATSIGGTVYKIVQLPPPTISVGDKAILEGDSGMRSLIFPVTLTQPGTSNVTVDYTVTSGGVDTIPGNSPKTTSGADFKPIAGTVTFKANAQGKTPISRSITVKAFSDLGAEDDETVTVTLSNPSSGSSLARDTATGTILNDDVASGVTLGIGDGSIVDANLGNQKLNFPLTLSARPGTPTTVTWTVTPGTAEFGTKKSGLDFGGKLSGSTTFGPGTMVKQIGFSIWPDFNVESDETFTVQITGVSGTSPTIVKSTGTGTILEP